MQSVESLERRWLASGDDVVRRALFARHFAAGPPRKLRAACARLPLERARVLDVGTGPGVYLAHFGPASLGLDKDPRAVELARSLGLNVLVRDANEAGWSRDLGRFDFAWLCDLLMHLEEPVGFLTELHAVLEPGARVVVCDWVFPERGLAAALARRVPGARQILSHPEHLRHFSREHLHALLHCAGFEVTERWLHSFDSPLAAWLAGSFWPPQTFLARAR